MEVYGCADHLYLPNTMSVDFIPEIPDLQDPQCLVHLSCVEGKPAGHLRPTLRGASHPLDVRPPSDSPSL